MRSALTSGLLLHGEGWDELIMIAVGLVAAFVVISMTGRRSNGEEPIEEVPADAAADEKADRA